MGSAHNTNHNYIYHLILIMLMIVHDYTDVINVERLKTISMQPVKYLVKEVVVDEL